MTYGYQAYEDAARADRPRLTLAERNAELAVQVVDGMLAVARDIEALAALLLARWEERQ